MKLRNERTGDVLSVPPPGPLGDSVVLLNGEVVERVLYGDDSITLGNGIMFKTGEGFAKYIVEKLAHGWKRL